MKCRKCGREVQETWNICPYCKNQIRMAKNESDSTDPSSSESTPLVVRKRAEDIKRRERDYMPNPRVARRTQRDHGYYNQDIDSNDMTNEYDDFDGTGRDTVRSYRNRPEKYDMNKLKYFSFAKYVIFSILTAGIYSIVTLYRFNNTVNILCEGDEQETLNYFLVILLGVLTLGIYTQYWTYKQAKRIYEIAPRYQCRTAGDNSKAILMWSTFGSFILVGPFIAWNKMFANVNQLIKRYNRRSGRDYYEIHHTKSNAPAFIIGGFYLVQLLLILVPVLLLWGMLFSGDKSDLSKMENITREYISEKTYETNGFLQTESDDKTIAVNNKQSEKNDSANVSKTENKTVYSEEEVFALYENIIMDADSWSDGRAKYVLYDLDCDGISELILSAGTCNADWTETVYYLQDGSVTSSFSSYGPCTYYEGENGIGAYAIYIHQGGSQDVRLITKEGDQIGMQIVLQGGDATSYTYSSEIELKTYGNVQQETSGYTSNENSNINVNYGGTSDADGYVFPESSYVEFSGAIDAPVWMYQYGINEIYAKHGYVFSNQEVQDLFEWKNWYFPDYNFSSAQLSDIEQKNINYFSNCIAASGEDAGLGIPSNAPSF